MNNVAEESEQSMEDILQSIKKIIADDDDTGNNAEETVAKIADTTPDNNDVFDLNDIVEDTTAAPKPDDKADDYAALDDVLSHDDKADAAADIPDEEADGQSGSDDDILASIDTLLDEPAIASSSTAIEALKQAKPKDQPVEEAPLNIPSIPLRSGTTVEDLVVEALKPELRDWLNTNLPELVERMVAAEIKKITQ